MTDLDLESGTDFNYDDDGRYDNLIGEDELKSKLDSAESPNDAETSQDQIEEEEQAYTAIHS